MARHNQWHVELTGWRLVLLPFAFIAALLVQLAVRIFGLSNSADLTADDVASYLRNFLEGGGGEWDWDDFTSIPITDPSLEAIRYEAEMVQLPIDDAGEAKLRELLAKARSLLPPNVCNGWKAAVSPHPFLGAVGAIIHVLGPWPICGPNSRPSTLHLFGFQTPQQQVEHRMMYTVL